MSEILYATADNAEGQLNAGITGGSTSIVLKAGEGAEFPQPYTGTATSTGDSQTLNDTGDLGSLSVGDFIRNVTDGSFAFVITTGTNSVTTTRLQGGTDNTWESSDEWQVDEFVVTLEKRDADGDVTQREKVLIKDRSTDTLTVRTRGYDGSSAQSFDADDYVNLHVTSITIEEMIDVIYGVNKRADDLIDDLASTANAKGASTVGVEDSAAHFTGTTIEAVLAELQVNINNAATVPSGTLAPYGGSSAPSGWLLCDGDLVSLTTYESLYDVVTTNFGSVGSITGGLAAAAFTADHTTETFTSSSHGLSNDDVVILTTSGTLPAGLSTATKYYVINKTTNTFQLSTSSGGSAVAISDNGSGTHTFNPGFPVPDMRGRAPVGIDNLGGSSANIVTDSSADSIGGTHGTEIHTLTVDEMPSHTHTVAVSDTTGSATGSGGEGANSNNTTSSSAGGDQAHENMQPSLFVNYIIKT